MSALAEAPTGKPPYHIAAAVGIGIFALYAATVAPTTQFWDASEYIAAAKVLGIPHPPGNPLFVLLANVWGQIPIVPHYALRINLFAAATSAVASALLFLVAERFLRSLMPHDRWPRSVAAIAGVIVGATAFTVWNQSTVNEKVYTVSLLSIALVVWLTVRWGDLDPGPRRDKLIVLIVYLLALTATNHLMGLLAAPFVLVYVLHDDRRVLLSGRMWLAFVAVAVVAMGVWVVLPIRAALFPPINEGEPTTWDAFWLVLSRDQYQKGPLIPRQADLVWQYVNYLQYFAWQFGKDWEPAIRRGWATIFAALGILGGVAQWRRDRRSAMAMIALMLTVTVLLVFYLDFKFGYSIRLPENLPREVRERDYFFVASFLLWGVWVALGFGVALEWVARTFEDRLRGARKWLPATPILALCFVPFAGNRISASRAGETLPRDMAWDILQSAEPYGIVMTAGDNDTFPLWYMQEVEGVRRDVTVANLSLMNTDWHNRQIKRRGVIPFDTANAIPLYRGREWPAPTDPPLLMSYEQLDALPLILPVPEGRNVFEHGQIRAPIQQPFLERADIITLQLIRDNLGKRPIYLARTTGDYGERMGLTSYLLNQGLVRRLVVEPIAPSDSVVKVSGLGWLDVKRSHTLLFDLYHADTAARHRPLGWIDEPSERILALYAIIYASYADVIAARLADTTQTTADSASAAALVQRSTELADRILANTSFGR